MLFIQYIMFIIQYIMFIQNILLLICILFVMICTFSPVNCFRKRLRDYLIMVIRITIPLVMHLLCTGEKLLHSCASSNDDNIMM